MLFRSDGAGVTISYSLIIGGRASNVTLFVCLCRLGRPGRSSSTSETSLSHVLLSELYADLGLNFGVELKLDLIGDPSGFTAGDTCALLLIVLEL